MCEVMTMPRWPESEKTQLALIRSKAGFSREEASVRIGVGIATLGRYESGINDVPMGIAEKMAVIYCVPFDDIRAAIAKIAKEEQTA
jgi:transcriptional regulator with XRE-family HTH domain